MRKKRSSESIGQRSEKKAQARSDQAAAEEKAMDAMVKRSIEQHGP